MANLCSIATGNWTAAATWSLVDTTSYLNSETGNQTLSTTEASNRAASGFTPGAIQISAIAVKIASRTASPSGTFSCQLFNLTDTAAVAGTSVTVDSADVPSSATASAEGGWFVFKLSAPVTLVAGKAYVVSPVTSVTAQLSLYRDGTTSNWSRMLLTTTTQAPVAGDDVVVAGEHTGSGTGNNFTVTMNETATTDYGSAPAVGNALVQPGVAVCKRGTLSYGTTAATNYYLKQSGSIVVYRDGTLNIGTTGTPIPRDSTAVLEFDPAADGDYGLIARNGSILNIQGLSRNSGKNVVACKLNTDEAVNSTSLGVDTDTGWLDNDIIAVASTTRTAAQCEAGTLNGNAGASSLTVDGFAGAGGGLAFAHDGTSPTQAEVILLTRNVKIRSATSTVMAYVNLKDQATVDIDWTEFRYLGDTASFKKGIDVSTTSAGDCNIQFCSIYDCEDNGVYLCAFANSDNQTFSNNVMWNLATVTGPGAQTGTSTSGTNIVIDSNILIKTGAGNGWTLADVGGTFTNNTVAGAAAIGISLNEGSNIGTFSGNSVHSCVSDGVNFTAGGTNGSLSTLTVWRQTGQGIEIASDIGDIIIENLVAFGNTTANILITNACSFWLKTPILNGDTTFSTVSGISLSTTRNANILIDDGDFSTVSGIKTAHTQDINISAANADFRITLRNTKLGAATEVSNQVGLGNWGYIASQKHDQTAGNHKTWMKNGTVQTDSTIFNTVAPSMRITPATQNEFSSAYQFNGIQVAVANGSTVTINAWVRKSSAADGADYDGVQPTLRLKANPAIGIAADAVLDTAAAANGTWEQLTGTTASATDDGVMEFVIVGDDASTGWINVDDWSAT